MKRLWHLVGCACFWPNRVDTLLIDRIAAFDWQRGRPEPESPQHDCAGLHGFIAGRRLVGQIMCRDVLGEVHISLLHFSGEYPRLVALKGLGYRLDFMRLAKGA